MIEQRSSLGRRRHKAAIAVTAVLSLLLGAFGLGTATNAFASTGLASIVCGGDKHFGGWQTYPTGGYVGEGCGAGIDYVMTPTQADEDGRNWPGVLFASVRPLVNEVGMLGSDQRPATCRGPGDRQGRCWLLCETRVRRQ